MEDNKPETIQEVLTSIVEKGSMVYCESGMLPDALKDIYEISELAAQRHSDGEIHVNNVKNMWKDLKRTIKQTHIQVSKKHLQLYCDEVAWRINHQHLTTSQKFDLLLKNSSLGPGKKSTYQKLIK